MPHDPDTVLGVGSGDEGYAGAALWQVAGPGKHFDAERWGDPPKTQARGHVSTADEHCAIARPWTHPVTPVWPDTTVVSV